MYILICIRFNERLTLKKENLPQFMVFEVKTTIKIVFEKYLNLDIFALKYYQPKTSLKMVKIKVQNK